MRARRAPMLVSDARSAKRIVLIITHHGNLCLLRHKCNDVLGTHGHAKSAAKAASGIHARNAVLCTDRIRRTSICTVSKTKTAEITSLGTAVNGRSGLARVNANVFCLHIYRAARAVTMHVSDNVLGSFNLDTQDLANLVCHTLSTGNAKIGLCFSLCQRSSIVVTALISASTAIDAGQTRSDRLCGLILLYCKELGNQRQQDCQEKGYNEGYSQSN